MEQVLLLASWTAALYVVVTAAGWFVRSDHTRVIPINPHRKRRPLHRHLRVHG